MSGKVSQAGPHEDFLKFCLSDADRAEEFVRNLLPEEVQKRMDLSTLAFQSDSFLDEDALHTFVDALFKVKHDAGWGYLYLLLELEKQPDKLTILRYNRCKMAVCQKILSEQVSDTMPPIDYMLMYWGKESEKRPSPISNRTLH